MAGTSLFALLDDITTLLDDVALLSKVAMKKTTGVLGDDLALNAQQTTGFAAERELPVVWAVAKGSLLNKLILVPTALLISAFAPWFITPLLMFGGLYLCYEGVEKLAHKFLHRAADATHEKAVHAAVVDANVDLAAFERDRIKGAIRTDFILSAEIVVIALGTMAAAPIAQQIVSLSVIGVGLTVMVYGLVAAIVKIDDLGLRLLTTAGPRGAQRAVGTALLRAAPLLMRVLSVAGTVAMFVVGGSILAHGIQAMESLSGLVKLLTEAAIGVAAGIAALAVVMLATRARSGRGSGG